MQALFARVRPWLGYFRAGDFLVLLATGTAVGFSFPLLWQGGLGDRAIVRQGGETVAELDLHSPRTLTVTGPLGETLIAVERGRARIVADPGPRQYCVRQGWLSRPGDIAICAPNRVSLAIRGRNRTYDSLSY